MRLRLGRAACGLALLLVLASPLACSVDGGATGTGPANGDAGGAISPGLTADAADGVCTTVQTGFCQKLQTCQPDVLAASWGDLATCIARNKLSCAASLQAPGVTVTPAQATACSAAYQAPACGDFLNRFIPECAFTGTIPDGTACVTDAQCKGTACRFLHDTDPCGTCATRGVAGGDCNFHHHDCAAGFACNGSAVCVAAVAVGGSCSDALPCDESLSCVGSKCVAAGSAVGQPCNGLGTCGEGSALTCVSDQCVALKFAADGQPCGTLTAGQYTDCKRGHCIVAGGTTGRASPTRPTARHVTSRRDRAARIPPAAPTERASRPRRPMPKRATRSCLARCGCSALAVESVDGSGAHRQDRRGDGR
jgi:hypothetical protein